MAFQTISFILEIFRKFEAQLLLVFITVLLVIYLLRKQTKSSNYPPILWNLPLAGSLPGLLWSLYRSGLPLYDLMRLLKYTYGPVYALNVFGRMVVIINDFQSIQKAFNNPYLNDRPTLTGHPELNKIKANKGVGLSSGSVWYKQRRFTQTVFRSFGIGKNTFDEKIAIESGALITEIARFEGEAFDPRVLLVNAVSNVICSVVLGKRFDYSDQKFRNFQQLASRQFELVFKHFHHFFLPFFQYFPSKDFELALNSAHQLRSFIDGIVHDHKRDFNPENLRDYIDVYLNELRSNEEEPSRNSTKLDEENLRETIVQLFTGGTDTTSLTLRWCLLHMISHPEIQARVQLEIDEVVGRERLPMISDKASLPYTQATILEIQRMATVGRFPVPHVCSKTTTLFDYVIPEGAILMPNVWAVHRDPTVWTEPKVFKPERFLDEKGDLHQPKELIPFGTGRRTCLGDHLAKMELFIFFTHLLHKFTFEKSSSLECLPDVDQGRTPKEFLLRAIKRE